jgi:uronate dehydrogenase
VSVIALRIGWVRPCSNRVGDLPVDHEPWFRLMWLSTRDLCQLVERCIEADAGLRFAVLNGVSANTGTPWDLEAARRLVGYEPVDDAMRG